MKNVVVILAGVTAAVVVGWLVFFLSTGEYISPLGSETEDKPLQKYSFPRLKQASFTPSDIRIGEELDLGTDVQVNQFFYSDSFAPDKKISGSITFPDTPGTYPVVVLYRGWADEEVYYTGYGTKNAAAYFARNGYIAVAPDFLGYAASDERSYDTAESRFQTYTSALTLLRSLDNITAALEDEEDLNYVLDSERVGIWGHSNGGQITLSVLALTGEPIPTTLWAPVTIPFPDNILHYAGDNIDGGTYIRNLVADFRSEYNDEMYTPTSYLTWIDAPILLHQGGLDDAVPPKWSDDFAEAMEALGKDVTYYTYPNADHNMRPDWGTVIRRDLEHFNAYLKES